MGVRTGDDAAARPKPGILIPCDRTVSRARPAGQWKPVGTEKGLEVSNVPPDINDDRSLT